MLDSRIIVGDCQEVLAGMPPGSVQCVVTSPPYFGLRDYGTATWEGGDPQCQHAFAREDKRLMRGSDGTIGKNCTSWTHRDATPPRLCRCGARRIDSQLGLEATPEEYLAKMVVVFRAVKRVLRDDGCLFVNMGDKSTTGDPKSMRGHLPQKNLYGMPWRLALALQADGWYLRSDIIWSKPNPMPESTKDRPTKSHEYVFLLTKQPTYYWDAEAVREGDNVVTRKAGHSEAFCHSQADGKRHWGGKGGFADCDVTTVGRNIRTVWTIPTQAYPDAHFATFPEKLVEPCIRAGTSERGCCPECGAGWVRVVETSGGTIGKDWGGDLPRNTRLTEGAQRGSSARAQKMQDGTYTRTTTGWRPGCECREEIDTGGQNPDGSWINEYAIPEPIPCTVLDPFAGSGTVGVVCARENRAFVGIELNPEYAKMAEERIGKVMRVADDTRRQGTFAYGENPLDSPRGGG